jgi:hypothetical protein
MRGAKNGGKIGLWAVVHEEEIGGWRMTEMPGQVILEPDDRRVRDMEMLYHEEFPSNNGYFDSSDWSGFFDWWSVSKDYLGDPKPEYVSGTQNRQLKLDAGEIVGHAYDEQGLHEDGYETIGDDDFNELQAFLDQWCAKQLGTKTYYEDPGCLVRIPWELQV